MSLVRYRKMNSTLGKTMGVIICYLRVYLWQFSRFWLQLLSKQITIIWNATKNDINFIHEMRMHDETSNWFDTGKTTVYNVDLDRKKPIISFFDFVKTWVPFTLRCFVGSLIDISPVAVEKEALNFVNVFSFYIIFS